MVENACRSNGTKARRRFDLFKQLLRLLGLLVFVLILTRLDLSKLGSTLAETNLILLLISVPFFIPTFLVKSVRWGVILQEQGYRTSLWDRLLFNMAGFYVGAITPGRVGEFVRVLYLREQGIPTANSLFSVLLERVLDLLVIGTVSLLAIPLVLPQVRLPRGAPVALAALVAVGLFLWGATRLAWDRRGRGRPWWPFSYGVRERIVNWIHDFGRVVSDLTLQTALVAAFLTLLSIAVMYTGYYLLILALRIELSFLDMSAIVAVSQLIALLPVTISGIGTRDVWFIYAFGTRGLAPELAVALSVVLLFSYALSTLFGLGAWLVRPINYRGAHAKRDGVGPSHQ